MECRRPGMFWGMTDSPDTLCRSCCPTFCLPTWKGRDIHSVSNPKEFSVHSGLCNWVRCFSFSLAEPSFSCAIHQASALLSRAQTSYCSWRKCSGLQPGGPACDVRGTGQGGTEIGPSNREVFPWHWPPFSQPPLNPQAPLPRLSPGPWKPGLSFTWAADFSPWGGQSMFGTVFNFHPMVMLERRISHYIPSMSNIIP